MTPATTPLSLDLKKDAALTIQWQDGRRSVYPVLYLRSKCPCAACKEERKSLAAAKPKMSLRVLPGNFDKPLAATTAELVGNYALRIEWSDNHSSGIYSFDYLRGIDPDSAPHAKAGVP
jgi:DUF971 family protein